MKYKPAPRLGRQGTPQVAQRLQAYAYELGLALQIVTPAAEPWRRDYQRYMAHLWTGEGFASLGPSEAAGRKELERLVKLGHAKYFAAKIAGINAFIQWASAAA